MVLKASGRLSVMCARCTRGRETPRQSPRSRCTEAQVARILQVLLEQREKLIKRRYKKVKMKSHFGSVQAGFGVLGTRNQNPPEVAQRLFSARLPSQEGGGGQRNNPFYSLNVRPPLFSVGVFSPPL